MKSGFFRILFALICVFLLYGCAVIDKQLLVPASQHAKVNPLFRTADCKDYMMPTNGLIREIFMPKAVGGKGGGGFFVKDPCEHQALAINDISVDPAQQDKLHGEMCSLVEFKNQKDGTARNCSNYLISRSDEICELHKSHIYGDRTVMNTILGTLALGAGVAGTMTGAGAAHFLAGSAGFLTGGQALMDKEIYRNFVTHAILLKMDTRRNDFLKSPELAYRNEKNDDKKIGYAKVRDDAVKYHNLCSFYDGLTSLLDEAGGSKKTEAVNAVLVNQYKLKKQFVEKEIKALEAQLNDPKISPNNKAKIPDKLESRKRELFSIDETLSLAAAGGASGTISDTEQPKDETGDKANSGKKIDGNDIKGVQGALKKAGFDPGPIDGIPGSRTLAAIKAFQKTNKLANTGELTQETLNLLGSVDVLR